MLNKHNVRITQSERSYLNSLKRSIRQSIKSVEKELEPFQKDTYLKRKSSTRFTPVIKRTTVHTFKTREEFLREVEHLQKLKTDLSIYKPRKPKEYEDLPKRLQKRVDIERRRHQRNVRKLPPRSMRRQSAYDRLLRLRYVDKRNITYRQNMIDATIKTLPANYASHIAGGLKQMTEAQFLEFFLNFGPEVISYVYHDPQGMDPKSQRMLEAIEGVLSS